MQGYGGDKIFPNFIDETCMSLSVVRMRAHCCQKPVWIIEKPDNRATFTTVLALLLSDLVYTVLCVCVCLFCCVLAR